MPICSLIVDWTKYRRQQTIKRNVVEIRVPRDSAVAAAVDKRIVCIGLWLRIDFFDVCNPVCTRRNVNRCEQRQSKPILNDVDIDYICAAEEHVRTIAIAKVNVAVDTISDLASQLIDQHADASDGAAFSQNFGLRPQHIGTAVVFVFALSRFAKLNDSLLKLANNWLWSRDT